MAASFAGVGDVILPEPKAMIGFAGPRVIANTIHAELPPGVQTAEFMLQHGFVDRIVPRGELRREIARIIDYCGKEHIQARNKLRVGLRALLPGGKIKQHDPHHRG